MQGGPRRGRSPITGPALPCAAQASQTSPEGETLCPQGRMNETSPAGQARVARRAGVPNFAGGRNPVPAGQDERNIPRRAGESSSPRRRPNFAGGRNTVPAGQDERNIPRRAGESSSPRRRPNIAGGQKIQITTAAQAKIPRAAQAQKNKNPGCSGATGEICVCRRPNACGFRSRGCPRTARTAPQAAGAWAGRRGL